ncbi:MAG: hypothetical protein QME47_02555 [Candidatus Thermoplasmatota archaeon]|nr:hypothetical protein [Candidatus Thermoplasmatota archaeon]
MKIKDLKKRYKGEWLAIEVIKENDEGPVEGRLILHEKDRDKLWEKVKLTRGKTTYITFAGPPIEKGYAVAFIGEE